jgi:predicted RNase H-like HicB family nuclease
MVTVTYQAIFERAGDGTIWGHCPDVPGAAGAGDSLDEARESLRAGVKLWLEQAKEDGAELPPASNTVAIEQITIDAA